ncbi:hypothetical protein CsSME_00053327 [Camellia sinensis var. sinensis]
MDIYPFVRLIIDNLALKIPMASKPARSVVHPSSSSCFCNRESSLGDLSIDRCRTTALIGDPRV